SSLRSLRARCPPFAVHLTNLKEGIFSAAVAPPGDITGYQGEKCWRRCPAGGLAKLTGYISQSTASVSLELLPEFLYGLSKWQTSRLNHTYRVVPRPIVALFHESSVGRSRCFGSERQ